ncbi:hypothetical protein KY285_025871 [Solanum tuberosum]|nr:hypothetical protein KY285_025871 [Solanum tuberosum]
MLDIYEDLGMHIRILSGYGLAYNKFCCGGMLFSRWQLRNLLWCLSSNEHHEMSIDAKIGNKEIMDFDDLHQDPDPQYHLPKRASKSPKPRDSRRSQSLSKSPKLHDSRRSKSPSKSPKLRDSRRSKSMSKSPEPRNSRRSPSRSKSPKPRNSRRSPSRSRSRSRSGSLSRSSCSSGLL